MENKMTESRQRMTSLEIAEVTGKPHNDVMKAIRKMEPAWVRICQGKFSLTSRMVQQPNGGTREVPCYQRRNSRSSLLLSYKDRVSVCCNKI